MTFPLRGLASPAALLLCILPALSCDELPAPPEPEPLAPVLRVTELHWVVRDAAPESLDLYAEAALDAAATGLTLGGELAPALPSDGSPENPALVAGLSAALSALTEGGPELALGVEVAALGSDAPETLCFSPAEPESDPYLVTRSAALEAVLQAHPEITSLSVDLAAAPAPWDVDCSCADCEGGGASAQAARLVASFGALERAAQGFGLTPWWWDRLQSPGSDGLNASSVMDTALTELRPESELRVRVAPVRGQGGPWASPNPRLSDGLSRPTSVDLDLAGAAYGPTDALILLPRELHDTVMRARQLGATAWFASVDGGGRGILSRPDRANGWFAGELFRNLGARPSELLADWASQEWGIDASSEIGAELVDALDESGRALALTTHPLGLPVRNLDQGLGTLPLTYVDPRPWSDDWTERWEELGSPTQQTLVDVNQWGSEGVALSQAALEALRSGIDEGMFEAWQYLYFIPELATLMREPDFDAEMARIRAHMAEQRALAREMERQDPALR